MLQINSIQARSTFCKSAYPGSIPGVASKFSLENQSMTNELDAQGARVAKDARDKIRDNFPYTYAWNRPDGAGRKGQLCRVTARGTMNSCCVEFEDGFKMVTSRNALRKRK